MNHRIRLTNEQLDLLRTGNQINNENGQYLQWPYWVKKVDDPNDPMLYELFATAELPIEKDFKVTGLERQKYIVKKTNGIPVDPNAFYFVLRLDEDPHARRAALQYAHEVGPYNLKLAEELIHKVIGYEPEILRTSAEWQYFYPYVIMDADGWDRERIYESWSIEEITFQEFERRALLSTCIHKSTNEL